METLLIPLPLGKSFQKSLHWDDNRQGQRKGGGEPGDWRDESTHIRAWLQTNERWKLVNMHVAPDTPDYQWEAESGHLRTDLVNPPLGKLSHNFYMGEKLAQTDHVGEM